MLTDTEHSQGVISVVKKVKRGVDSLEEMKNCGSGNLVILDRLWDPGKRRNGHTDRGSCRI